MDRRHFIQLSAASLATGLVAPVATFAEGTAKKTADLYYTQESSGRWHGKEATHLPTIEVSTLNGKINVNVVTAHEMKGFEHYIVKHVLLDKDYQFIDEHMFNPTVDKTAISTFTLESYSGVFYSLSLCNKHDLWLASAEV